MTDVVMMQLPFNKTTPPFQLLPMPTTSINGIGRDMHVTGLKQPLMQHATQKIEIPNLQTALFIFFYSFLVAESQTYYKWYDEPAHAIKVLIAAAQKSHLFAYVDISTRARGLNFCLGLALPRFFVYTGSKSSSESG